MADGSPARPFCGSSRSPTSKYFGSPASKPSAGPRPKSPLRMDSNTEWRLSASFLRSNMACSQTEAEEPVNGDGSWIEKMNILSGGSSKKLAKYNKNQEAMLDEFEKLDAMMESGYDAAANELMHTKTTKWETFAINISNIANLTIFLGTIFVAILCGSLALVASALDSMLDLLSGLILWFTSIKMRKRNPYRYPIGKQRMQPVGLLCFSAVMATMGLQVVILSIQRFITHEKEVDLNGKKSYLVIIIMGFSIVVMFGLAIYCQTFKSKLVKAYADDHLFDALTNLVGLASAILAAKFKWWIDPLGALLLAIYTIICWIGTVRKHIGSLVGQTAPPEILQKITYVAWNHDKRIVQLDTVRAYSCGGEYVVEVDIVLPKEMQVGESHDIGEALQNKLETLPYVERAYVHIDYETTHKPEHAC